MEKFVKEIEEQIQSSIDAKLVIMQTEIDTIIEISELIVESIKAGKKVYLFGNGGSAADSQHIASELVGKFMEKRKAYPAIALTTNTSNLTSISNDFGYEVCFQKQLEAFAEEGDIAIAISTSGNSPNVIKAVEFCKENGIKTVGLTGKGGGKLKDLVDICIQVSTNETPRIQESHITIGHIICYIVEKELLAS